MNTDARKRPALSPVPGPGEVGTALASAVDLTGRTAPQPFIAQAHPNQKRPIEIITISSDDETYAPKAKTLKRKTGHRKKSQDDRDGWKARASALIEKKNHGIKCQTKENSYAVPAAHSVREALTPTLKQLSAQMLGPLQENLHKDGAIKLKSRKKAKDDTPVDFSFNYTAESEDNPWTFLPVPPAANGSSSRAIPTSSFWPPPNDAQTATNNLSAPGIIANEPPLCKEQQDLVDLIMSGANVFYTGSAGCGKSTVLKAFVKQLKDQGKTVHILAPTGRAALAVNGSTTWTYAGWTPDHHKRDIKILKRAAHGKFVRKRLSETHVMVIDEISMVENHHLERLNLIMKEARGRDIAFGGVQVIFTGDFCQLPPVKPFEYCMWCGKTMTRDISQTVYTCPHHGDFKDEDKWAFRSAAWEEAKLVHVNLKNIHRQSDKTFIDILQKCRVGTPLSPVDIGTLTNHPCDVENAVKLFSTRQEVKAVNDREFSKLMTKKVTYHCYDDFRWNQQHGNLKFKGERSFDGSLRSLAEHRFEASIQLKEGMLVVLLVNLELASGLVNGSQGVITGFEPYDAAKLPKSNNGKPPKNRDSDKHAPVPNSTPTLGGDHAQLREENIKAFIAQDKNTDKVWPIVTFDNGVVRTIYPDCTVNELGDETPYSLLSRTQLPLTAAWAMSIHKSQGMTLNRVIVDLAKSFEDGQMYVGLSRARSLEGLKVEGLYDARKAQMANTTVKEWLETKFGLR